MPYICRSLSPLLIIDNAEQNFRLGLLWTIVPLFSYGSDTTTVPLLWYHYFPTTLIPHTVPLLWYHYSTTSLIPLFSYDSDTTIFLRLWYHYFPTTLIPLFFCDSDTPAVPLLWYHVPVQCHKNIPLSYHFWCTATLPLQYHCDTTTLPLLWKPRWILALYSNTATTTC